VKGRESSSVFAEDFLVTCPIPPSVAGVLVTHLQDGTVSVRPDGMEYIMGFLLSECQDQVRINPAIITWARNRIGVSVEEASTLLNYTVEQIQSWEDASAEPSYPQALILANKLRFPFGYLFLSGLPHSEMPLPDLRTVLGAPPIAPSPDMLAVLEDAIRKQHWYSEYLASEGIKSRPFVGRFDANARLDIIAADVRQEIGINEQSRSESATPGAFLTRLTRNAEEAGVIVLRSGTACGNTHRPLSVSEFRGFALIDPIAPVIFINTRDAPVAQLFTFAHEIAHIWIGAAGVSNPDFHKKSVQQVNAIEVKCNQIAAETLVPTAGFLHAWNSGATLDNNIDLLRMRYRVSKMVILRKAYDTGLVEYSAFRTKMREFYDVELEKTLKKSDEKESSGHYYNALFARNSSTLTAAVTSAYSGGSLLVTEACSLLGVKTQVLGKLVTAA
jgi:Zn-dependent peptidase ImmA (M78 family)/DNA-binding transcriptional regulator YiaG